MTAMHEPLLAVVPPALPEPLVPAEVDLRDFAFMPLDVVRLRDSGLTAKATGEEFRAAVLLWCASWHQQPAASLPNDDDELASLCGYGRAPREWAKVRKGALRGWVECADGRLYHPLVATKACEAWQMKLAQRARTEAARKAREEQRQRQLQGLSQTAQTSVTDIATESKGQGQGQGQGLRKDSPSPDGEGVAPAKPGPARVPNVDHDAVVAAYHELLPTLPRVVEWGDKRQGLLRARWRQLAEIDARKGRAWADTGQGVARFRKLFAYVGESKFLMGKVNGSNGRPPFQAELPWLLAPENFLKLIEGKYHQEA